MVTKEQIADELTQLSESDLQELQLLITKLIKQNQMVLKIMSWHNYGK